MTKGSTKTPVFHQRFLRCEINFMGEKIWYSMLPTDYFLPRSNIEKQKALAHLKRLRAMCTPLVAVSKPTNHFKLVA